MTKIFQFGISKTAIGIASGAMGEPCLFIADAAPTEAPLGSVSSEPPPAHADQVILSFRNIDGLNILRKNLDQIAESFKVKDENKED